jgi:lipoprotein-releasing system ATP-binding protein
MNEQASEPLIVARDLHKSYVLGKRVVDVLRGVSLTVRRGEFHAVRGASGAGKSTLLHLLGGLDTPNTGEILFKGALFSRFTEKEMTQFRNRKIGFIFQAYHLLPELDALENVCLPARMARLDARKTEIKARGILERVGLSDRLEHRPYELSGGEQQRVSIARALVNDPELILADEPTGNLDSHTGQGIVDLLCELQRERDATLIIATHDAGLAARAPHVMQIVDGLVA